MATGYLRSTVVFSILAREWPDVKARLDARRRPATTRSANAVLDRVAARYPEWSGSRRVKQASVLPAAATPVIDRAAQLFHEFPTLLVEVNGHTDDREGKSEGEREAIALARAEIVRAYLIDVHGVDPAQITTRSAGSTEPIDSNATAGGRANNRRTDFTILRQ